MPTSPVPVYAVGGWADAYTNAIPRLLAGLPGPRKGLIGPWAHNYPRSGVPGPAIGFLQECLRWWDHWLKGIDTGIMDEPMLRVWMQDSVPPSTHYAERPGRWVAEPAWPSPNVAPRTLLAESAARWTTRRRPRSGSNYQGAQYAGCTPASGVPMARPAICPPTSGPRTACRCALRRRRWPSRWRFWVFPRSR